MLNKWHHYDIYYDHPFLYLHFFGKSSGFLLTDGALWHGTCMICSRARSCSPRFSTAVAAAAPKFLGSASLGFSACGVSWSPCNQLRQQKASKEQLHFFNKKKKKKKEQQKKSISNTSNHHSWLGRQLSPSNRRSLHIRIY